MNKICKRVAKILAALVLLGGGTPALAQGIPSAVVRISYGDVPAPDAAICSGALVAPDLVLTAAHCVRNAAENPAILRFDAGWKAGVIGDSGGSGKSGGQRRGKQVILTGPAPVAGLSELTGDVALVILDTPFLPEAALPLPVALPSDAEFILHAFRRDASDRPALPVACALLATRPGLLGLDCPVVSGNSGAPLLQRQGEGWQIVAVMVAASRLGPVRSWAVLPPETLQRQIPPLPEGG